MIKRKNDMKREVNFTASIFWIICGKDNILLAYFKECELFYRRIKKYMDQTTVIQKIFGFLFHKNKKPVSLFMKKIYFYYLYLPLLK